MKNRDALLLAGLVVLESGTAAARAEPSPQTFQDWNLVVAENAIASEIYAAEEFQRLFSDATGIKLPVSRDFSGGTNSFFIGASNALTESALGHAMNDPLASDDIRLVVAEGNVAILGGRPRGTLYAVYQFLEDRLGVRFLTRDHTHVPNLRDPGILREKDLLRPLDYTHRPQLKCRLIYYTDVMDQPEFSARLRVNATAPGFLSKHEERARKIGGFVDPNPFLLLHSVGSWANGINKERDPTVMALWNAARSPNQPCLSHPDVIEAVTRNVKAAARKAAPGSLLRVVQEDAPRCECDRCRDVWAQHGDKASAVVIRLVNHLARELSAMGRPDITVGTLAYAWSAQPPDDLPVEPGVRIQFATYHGCLQHGYRCPECPTNMGMHADIQQWRQLCDDLIFWHYTLNFSDYLQPPVNVESLGLQLKAMHDTGTKGIFLQGPGSGINAPFADMVIYVAAHLLWDPNIDPMRLVNEFVDLHYGSATPHIHEFLALIRRTLQNNPGHSNCNGHLREWGLSPDVGFQGIEIFNRALATADSHHVRARVEKASIGAYRLALGTYFKNEEPVPEEKRGTIRDLARTLFQLTDVHNVAEYLEGRRMDVAKRNVRKALGMAEDEAF